MTVISDEVQFSVYGDEDVTHTSYDIWTWWYIPSGEYLFIYLALKAAASVKDTKKGLCAQKFI